MLNRIAVTVFAALAVAAPAHAASVAYIEDHNLWLSSPDGAQRFQVTTGGVEDQAWNNPSQGPDGRTVVVRKERLDEESSPRPVLYLFGADGKLQAANVMPVYSGATIPVYPIGLDMDWDSQAVAYGYQYCGFACNTTHKGYWLTFSDQQSLYPTNPQGQSDAYFPTFYGKRIVSSDSGGSIFVQPDVEEAPFTNSYQGWLHYDGFHLYRAEVAMTGSFVGLDWSTTDPGSGQTVYGMSIGRHQGTVPSDVTQICDVQVAGNPDSLTFSYDGTQMAWKDDEGVKVAGVPNLDAGTGVCTLTAPPVVISPTGRQPHFGGADVGAILNAGQAGGGDGGGTTTGGDGDGGGQAPGEGAGGSGGAGAGLTVTVPKLTAKAFARGLALTVNATRAGRVTASATIPAAVARRVGLAPRARSGSLSAAAAKAVVIARGTATAKGPGPVKVTVRPTPAAKRAARRLRRVVVTIRVSQGSVSKKESLRLR